MKTFCFSMINTKHYKTNVEASINIYLICNVRLEKTETNPDAK